MNDFNPLTDKTIKSPEGVHSLLESLWYRRKSGHNSNGNNVYMVDLPPLTEEEKSQIDRRTTVKPKDTREVPVTSNLTLTKRIRSDIIGKTSLLHRVYIP